MRLRFRNQFPSQRPLAGIRLIETENAQSPPLRPIPNEHPSLSAHDIPEPVDLVAHLTTERRFTSAGISAHIWLRQYAPCLVQTVQSALGAYLREQALSLRGSVFIHLGQLELGDPPHPNPSRDGWLDFPRNFRNYRAVITDITFAPAPTFEADFNRHQAKMLHIIAGAMDGLNLVNIPYSLRECLRQAYPQYASGDDPVYQRKYLHEVQHRVLDVRSSTPHPHTPGESSAHTCFSNRVCVGTTFTGLCRYLLELKAGDYDRIVDYISSAPPDVVIALDIIAAHYLSSASMGASGHQNGHRRRGPKDLGGSHLLQAASGHVIAREIVSSVLSQISNVGRVVTLNRGHLELPIQSDLVRAWLHEHCPLLLDNVFCDSGIPPSDMQYTLTKSLPNLPGGAFHINNSLPQVGELCEFNDGGDVHPDSNCHLFSGANTKRQFISYTVRQTKHRRFLKILNRLYPPSSAVDNKHLTMHLADFVYHYVQGVGIMGRAHRCPIGGASTPAARLRRVNDILARVPVGTCQQVVIAMLMTCLGHRDGQLIYDNMLASGILWRDVVSQKDALKELGTYVRKTSLDIRGVELSNDQVSSLAYYDLLFGRSAFKTDWEQEIRNRCSHTIHIQHPRDVAPKQGDRMNRGWLSDATLLDPTAMQEDENFYCRLREEIVVIARKLVTRRNTREAFQDFFARRHEWIASGSSSGFSVDVAQPQSGAITKVKGQKRAWAENVTYEHAREALENPNPAEIAHASEKMENGKSRAIYGVEPMHYVINTYATKGFEERLHLVDGLEKGASGSLALRYEKLRAHITADPTKECTMLDYADFNRHHTPRAQKMIFDVFAELGRSVGAHPDWIQANEWVARSKMNMKCFFPGDKVARPVLQGMFSGTRSTDLINTILNLAYFRIAERWVADRLSLTPQSLYHVHQGDDVWITNDNPVWARELYYTLHNMGFLFQENKQMFGSGRGEYLRVLYGQGSGRGYVARAVANFLLRPLQQRMGVDPYAWANTVRDGCSLLMRRGLNVDMAQVLYEDNMGYWARVRAHERDFAPVSLPKDLLYADPLNGGLGTAPPGTTWCGPSLRKVGEPPRFRSTLNSYPYKLPRHMTEDWIKFVSTKTRKYGKAPLSFRADALRDSMANENYADVVEQLQREKGWVELKRKMTSYRDALNDAVADCPLHTTMVPLDLDIVGRKRAHHRRLVEVRNVADVVQTKLHFPASMGGVSQHPAWNRHLRSMASISHPNMPFQDYNQLSSQVNSLIIRSRFKNERRTAQAYGVGLSKALSLIISEMGESGHGNVLVAATLAPYINCHNHSVIELLLCGGGVLAPELGDYVNAGLANYCQQMLMQVLISVNCVQPHLLPEQMVAKSGLVAKSWIENACLSRQVRLDVLY